MRDNCFYVKNFYIIFMKRACLFKTYLYLNFMRFTQEPLQAEFFVKDIFNKKDISEFINPFLPKSALSLSDNVIYNFLVSYYIHVSSSRNFAEFVRKYLCEDIEVKTNKDFYFKSLFNEIFFYVDIHDDSLKIPLMNFNKNFNAISSSKKLKNQQIISEESSRLLCIVNTNEDNDVYGALRDLLYDILAYRVKNNSSFFNTLPKHSDLLNLKDVILNGRYRDFANFFDEPFNEKIFILENVWCPLLEPISENTVLI